jgi:hypothetical protein
MDDTKFTEIAYDTLRAWAHSTDEAACMRVRQLAFGNYEPTIYIHNEPLTPEQLNIARRIARTVLGVT